MWYVDGNVAYFSLKHYILMAAAVLFLILAVPYTLVLLFDAVIEKYLTRIRLFREQWIKFKPFVDAYHGPYKGFGLVYYFWFVCHSHLHLSI